MILFMHLYLLLSIPGEKGRETMSDEEKLVSHYQLKTLLRRDGFGAVYLAEDTRDQKEHILRVIELDQQTLARITGRVRARSQRDHPLVEQIRQRIKRISELRHAHILSVIEFGEEHIQGNNDIIFYMVSPYEKESLLSYWSEHYSSDELITLDVIADLVFQAGEALFYAHKRGLVYQYIRLSSFMLRSSARSRRHLHLLLTDFWFADISAAILEEGQISQDLSVYLAPEQLEGRALAASDQYTLAIMAYELLLGHRLSQVDLSLGLYQRFVRQRSTEVSTADLEVARRLDLVLARAMAEDASARFNNIEEFAYTFRGVIRGEAIDLSDEETFKLPVVSPTERRGRKRDEEIALAAAGALAAGEIAGEIAETRANGDSTAEMLAAAEVDEEIHPEHRHGLHKTVLTSEGMEVVELGAAGELLEETTISRETVEDGQVVEEETITAIDEEETQPSIPLAGFAAGLAVGEALQQEADIADEQTLIRESSAAAFAAGLAAGEALQQEADIADEQMLIRESNAAAFAAGLAAGEALTFEQEADEQTQIIEGGGALAAGAAGLAAGEAMAFEQEADIADEQTQIIEGGALLAGAAGLAAGEAMAFEQEADIANEQTQIIEGGALGAGAAGLAAGGILAGGIEAGQATQTSETVLAAGAAGAGLAGGLVGAGLAAGAVGAGMGVLESTGGAIGGAGVAAGGFSGGAAGGRRRRGRRWLTAVLAALIAFLVIGTLLFALLQFANQSTATVTLTLQSHTIQNSYLVTAVTGTVGQGEVQASLLTQTVSQSKTGQASGFFSGTHATGFITFRNTSTGCGCPVIIPAGTAFRGASGVTVVTDTVASVASMCTVTVAAHAVIFGAGGDIRAGDIHAALSSYVSATNASGFSGGQSGQSNAIIQQSDIQKPGLSAAKTGPTERAGGHSVSGHRQPALAWHTALPDENDFQSHGGRFRGQRNCHGKHNLHG